MRLDRGAGGAWNKFVMDWCVTPDEQSCDQLKSLVEGGRPYEAALELQGMRRVEAQDAADARELPRPPQRDSPLERRLAAALARIAAKSPALEVRQMRQSVIGHTEPLTPREAWAFLDRHKSSRGIRPAGEAWPGGQPLEVRDRTGRRGRYRVGAKTPLAALWVWSDFVAPSLLWPKPSAAWWVLTDETPQLSAIWVSLEESNPRRAHLSRISICAMPHVSPESVAAAFEQERRELFGVWRGAVAVGRRAMADFVDHQRNSTAKLPPWATLLALWNETVPTAWHYPNWRNMQRAYTHERAAAAKRHDRDG